MATYSSIPAWRIPWTEEPGKLQSIGLQSWTQLKQHSTHTHNRQRNYSIRREKLKANVNKWLREGGRKETPVNESKKQQKGVGEPGRCRVTGGNAARSL